MKEEMTQEYLKSILRYNPSTGLFKWRNNGYGRRINSIAGYKSRKGYIQITHNKKKYQAHRLAWLYMEGYWVEFFIDHINRKTWDNRWDNLRHVSPSCNSQNCSISKRNTSGVTGVALIKRKKKSDLWQANIYINNELIYLKSSINLDIAVKARYEAEVKYNWFTCQSDSSAYRYLKQKGLID